jgi:hypothetical protein
MVTYTSGRNQKRENDLRFSAKAAGQLGQEFRNTKPYSTYLIVPTSTIVSPSPFAKYALCQFLHILNQLREPLKGKVLTSISDKFNTARGCGSAALAFSMRFSSAVGSFLVRGTVAGSISPMRAERGSVSSMPGECIGKNALLYGQSIFHQCAHMRVQGRDEPTSRPSRRT